MKTAFLFPGQGSQYVGMGQALCARYPSARRTYAEAEDALGWDVAKLSFSGPEARLNQTEYTQPALLTASIAAWRALGEPVKQAAVVAGHSLGEYTALVAAGALQFGDAVRIVQLRGRLMQAAAPEGSGAMAAIIGLPRDRVEAICRKAAGDGTVVPANYNGPSQIVISGDAEGVKRAVALAEAEGAKRAVRLAVSVPSHSPLMREACLHLSKALDAVPGRDLEVPLINNCAAQEIRTWQAAKEGLVTQLAAPLLWEETLLSMQKMGVGQFIEVGPGRVLSGLVKRIDRRAKVMAIGDPEGIEAGLARLKCVPF